MKNHILASILLFQLCVLLTACGTAEEETAKEITWQGIAPGMENLTDITERTEFYDVTVESEALFDFDIKTQTPKIYDTETSTLSGEGTDWVPIGTQFLQGEPRFILNGAREIWQVSCALNLLSEQEVFDCSEQAFFG